MVITARRESLGKISQAGLIESDRFKIRSLDVTSREQRNQLIKAISVDWGGVDILVNNAGFAYRSVIEEMDNNAEQSQMATNYLGPLSLIRLVLPNMRAKGRGKIINVSSVSGMLAMPTMGSYSASKHALHGASEALWYELRPFGIDVSLVQPGFIRSKSFERTRYSRKSDPLVSRFGDYSDFYTHMEPFVKKLMERSWVTSHDVAVVIYKVISKQRPRFVVPATPDAVIFYYLRKFMPRRFFLVFLYNMLPGARKWAKNKSRARKMSLLRRFLILLGWS